MTNSNNVNDATDNYPLVANTDQKYNDEGGFEPRRKHMMKLVKKSLRYSTAWGREPFTRRRK